MTLPLRLENLQNETDGLISILQNKQDELGENEIFFEKIPNIISLYNEIKSEILSGAENLEVTEEQQEGGSGDLWDKLITFLNSLQGYYKYTEKEIPEWMYYKPQTNERGLDFFQQLFDTINETFEQSLIDKFDSGAETTIEEAKNIFETRKDHIKTGDWDIYMEKVHKMIGFKHQIKGSLRLIGLSENDIKNELDSQSQSN